MKKNKKYESLLNENVVDGTVFTDNEIFYVSIKLIKLQDDQGNYAVTINTDSKEIFDCKSNLIKINCSNSDEELIIEVGITNRGFNDSFQIKGYLIGIVSKSLNADVTNLNYQIPNSSALPFIKFDFKWTNKIQLENDNYDINCHILNDLIQVSLPNAITIQNKEYLALRNIIDKKIQYLTTLLSFCRSTTVEWESCIEKNNDEEVAFRFMKVNTAKIFPNKLNPFRQNPEFWTNFIEHSVKSDIELQRLIDNGVFQACGNLRWGCYLDEMTLIRHVAALEGICRLRNDKGHLVSVVNEEKWKKFRQLRKAPLKKAMQEAGFNDDEIVQIRKNIGDNSRILNSLPIKEQIEQFFTQNKLQKYYSINKKSINSAFNVRNKIVHEGWNPKWDKELSTYIFTTRNALFVTILSILDYKGKFYLCGEEEPIDLIKITDKNNVREGI